MNSVRDLTQSLLRSAGWPRERHQANPFRVSNMLEHVGGSVRRLVPPSGRQLVQGEDGKATLLVLDDANSALYRIILRVEGDEATVDAEMLDLARRVVRVSVIEDQFDEDGRRVLKFRWRFEFDGTDPVDIQDEQTSPGDGPAGPTYRFGRAIAEAAGWAPEQRQGEEGRSA